MKVKTTLAIKISIFTAALLAVVKFCTGILTQSMAVIASALDSFMDVGVSTVNLIAAKEAAKPPDEEHEYGHGKIESLAGLIQSQVIILTGFFIVFQSIKRWISGGVVQRFEIGIGVMFFSVLVTVALVLFLRFVGKQNPSIILSTEKLHFTTDLLAHLGVILGLFLVRYTGSIYWDLVISIGLSVYIFIAAFQILKRSVDELLDHSLGPVRKDQIETIIHNHHPAIIGIHNFRSHQVGERIFLDFHIEIRGVTDFRKAHDITESLIDEIKQNYPGADVTIHYDPEGAD